MKAVEDFSEKSDARAARFVVGLNARIVMGGINGAILLHARIVEVWEGVMISLRQNACRVPGQDVLG